MEERCDRNRQRVSQSADGELDAVGRVLLALHLLLCRGCREFRNELLAFTTALRGRARPAPVLRLARMPALAAVAVTLLVGVVGLNSLRSDEGSAGVGALSPVQGMPVYHLPKGFPVDLGKDRAG